MAKEHGLNVNHFLAVVSCESNWNPQAVSPTNDYGIAQIHIKSWGFTKEQAFDPAFSLDFMAKQWDEGNASAWVCWQKLYS